MRAFGDAPDIRSDLAGVDGVFVGSIASTSREVLDEHIWFEPGTPL
jgi:hypothetical protein